MVYDPLLKRKTRKNIVCHLLPLQKLGLKATLELEVIGVNAPGEEFYYTPTQISLSAATQSLMMALVKLYFVVLIQRKQVLL